MLSCVLVFQVLYFFSFKCTILHLSPFRVVKVFRKQASHERVIELNHGHLAPLGNRCQTVGKASDKGGGGVGVNFLKRTHTGMMGAKDKGVQFVMR